MISNCGGLGKGRFPGLTSLQQLYNSLLVATALRLRSTAQLQSSQVLMCQHRAWPSGPHWEMVSTQMDARRPSRAWCWDRCV